MAEGANPAWLAVARGEAPLVVSLPHSGTEIPAEHWQAVAEIIAYVWRLRRPRGG